MAWCDMMMWRGVSWRDVMWRSVASCGVMAYAFLLSFKKFALRFSEQVCHVQTVALLLASWIN